VQAERRGNCTASADFAVRVGVHTGDVALGAGVEADNTAMGAAVNIAARMEQSAPPGTLRISHDTWSQVRGLFDMRRSRRCRSRASKRRCRPTWCAPRWTAARPASSAGCRGLATPMVGRDAELQRLLQAVAQARQTRQLQALTLLGDAGLGKSRLLRELTAVRCKTAACSSLRSQPDGQLRPWGLLRSLLAAQCGVADTDSAEVARRKVVEGLSPCFDERGERQAQLIGQLSGLDFADSPHRARAWTRAACATRPSTRCAPTCSRWPARGALPVLLVEDLHWADDSSLDLLQHLLAHAAELPLALVMTAGLRCCAPARLGHAADRTRAAQPAGRCPQSDALAQALLQRLVTCRRS
jgi:hypothetical protein